MIVFDSLVLCCHCGSAVAVRPPRSRSGTTTPRPLREGPAQAGRRQQRGRHCGCRGSSSRSPSLDAAHVWDVVEDKAGNLFVATGDEGKVYKVTPDGKVSGRLRPAQDSQVLCLAAGARRRRLRRHRAERADRPHRRRTATPRCIYDSPESYVWSLAVDAKGETLYAGTGPKGRIYQVDADGKADVFYTTKQEHILCLAAGADGTLYAGTDKDGLVYRIDAKGKGFVLYQAPQAEVRSCWSTADGVYAGTSSPARKRPPAAGGGSTPAAAAAGIGSRPRPRAGRPRSASRAKDGSAVVAVVQSADAKERSKRQSAPAPPPPARRELASTASPPTARSARCSATRRWCSACCDQDGRLLVGTGMDGQLFEVDEATKERSEIARLDHGQIHCLLPPQGRLASSSAPATPASSTSSGPLRRQGHGRLRGARRQDRQQVGRAALAGRHAGRARR